MTTTLGFSEPEADGRPPSAMQGQGRAGGWLSWDSSLHVYRCRRKNTARQILLILFLILILISLRGPTAGVRLSVRLFAPASVQASGHWLESPPDRHLLFLIEVNRSQQA